MVPKIALGVRFLSYVYERSVEDFIVLIEISESKTMYKMI